MAPAPVAAPRAGAVSPGAAAPAAPAAQPAAKPAEEGGMFAKVLGTLGQLFNNLFVQGGLGIAAALPWPGIAQIASVAGAIVSLGAFLKSVLSGNPDWLALGSGLLYGAGIFMHGVGAFGGLLGAVGAMRGDRAKAADPAPRVAGAPAQSAEEELAARRRRDQAAAPPAAPAPVLMPVS